MRPESFAISLDLRYYKNILFPSDEGKCPKGQRGAEKMRTIHDTKEKLKYRKILRNNPTAQEIILWSRLRRKQSGYKFRRQHSIGKYITDFYCSEKKLIIELDGWQHTLEKDRQYDQERTEFFQKLGYKVLRFWNNDINNNLEGVYLEIEKYL